MIIEYIYYSILLSYSILYDNVNVNHGIMHYNSLYTLYNCIYIYYTSRININLNVCLYRSSVTLYSQINVVHR